MQEQYNKNTEVESYDNEFNNPTLRSKNSEFELLFEQTRETLDVETYNTFLKNAISRFRGSKSYKHYKSFLLSLGLDHCQFLGNISDEMAPLEMHHNILTIYDIAIIITEHVLNTKGHITTFDLAFLLKQAHITHTVQLVMLSLTVHQVYHNEPDFLIHQDMCIGNWYEFIKKYNKGLTQPIASKIMFYISRCLNNGTSNAKELLELRDYVYNWSMMNP